MDAVQWQKKAVERARLHDFRKQQYRGKAANREYADRTARQVEELELLREQAAVTKDELANHVAEQLNARMYLLAIVTTVFLPLGLLTGLLGINVGGMPGAQDPRAFWLVCGILAAVGGAIAALLRWLRWY